MPTKAPRTRSLITSRIRSETATARSSCSLEVNPSQASSLGVQICAEALFYKTLATQPALSSTIWRTAITIKRRIQGKTLSYYLLVTRSCKETLNLVKYVKVSKVSTRIKCVSSPYCGAPKVTTMLIKYSSRLNRKMQHLKQGNASNKLRKKSADCSKYEVYNKILSISLLNTK